MGWIETLKSSNLVWAILSICTCLGVPFFIVTVITGKHKKEFTYARTTFQLVSEGVSSINKLKLLFDETPISDLSVTRFTIWNSGTEEIKREDLYSNQPLCIINHTETAQILDASIIPESDEKQKFNLSMNEERDVEVDFECAEKKDGVVIQVIHSGNADELKPTIGIKGGKEIQTYYANSMRNPNSKKSNKIRFFYFGLIVCFLITGIYISFSTYKTYARFKRSSDPSQIIVFGVDSFQISNNDGKIEISRTPDSDNRISEDENDVKNRIIEENKKMSSKFLIGFFCSVSFCLSLFFCLIELIWIEYNMSIPPKLRKYVKVEITS